MNGHTTNIVWFFVDPAFFQRNAKLPDTLDKNVDWYGYKGTWQRLIWINNEATTLSRGLHFAGKWGYELTRLTPENPRIWADGSVTFTLKAAFDNPVHQNGSVQEWHYNYVDGATSFSDPLVRSLVTEGRTIVPCLPAGRLYAQRTWTTTERVPKSQSSAVWVPSSNALLAAAPTGSWETQATTIWENQVTRHSGKVPITVPAIPENLVILKRRAPRPPNP